MVKVKKIMGSFLVAAMVVGTVGNVTALANNHEDKAFRFSFNNQQVYTGARAKKDTSKLYMKCTSIGANKSYMAHAVGCTSASSGDSVDCSNGHCYRFSSSGEYHYMTSWVKEYGYGYARIAASPNYAYSFSASGVWSPDNVNQY